MKRRWRPVVLGTLGLFAASVRAGAVEIDDVVAASTLTHVGSYTLDYKAAGISGSKGCHNQSLKIGSGVIFSTCVASDGAYMFVHNLANPITYKCHVKRSDYGASTNTHVGGSVSLGNDEFLTVLTDAGGAGKMKLLKVNSTCGATIQYSSDTWGDKAGMVIRASAANSNIQVWNYASDKYSECSPTGAACGAKTSVANAGFDAQECMKSNNTTSWVSICSGLPVLQPSAKAVSTKFSVFSKTIPFKVNGSQLDYEGLDYQYPSGFGAARVWAASHASPFASSGSCGSFTLPCTDSSGRQWIHKFRLDQ